MKKRILFSGLGGSPFPSLHRSLAAKYDLYYVDSDPELKFLYSDYNFFPAPSVADDNYFSFVADIIRTCQIEYYIPLIDEEIIGAKAAFDEKNGVRVITPVADFSALCMDKHRLMNSLAENGLSSIKTVTGSDFHNDMFFPAFIKPNAGRGSRGIQKVMNSDEYNAYYILEKYGKDDTIIQEFISGEEYTVGVSVNRKNKILSVANRRIIRKRGITQLAINENNEIIERLAEQIVDTYKPCGPFNIQLYITPAGEAKVFEINPRFSTTVIMSYAGGVDEVSLCIDNDDATGFSLVRPKEGVVLHRRWESYFYER